MFAFNNNIIEINSCLADNDHYYFKMFVIIEF